MVRRGLIGLSVLIYLGCGQPTVPEETRSGQALSLVLKPGGFETNRQDRPERAQFALLTEVGTLTTGKSRDVTATRFVVAPADTTGAEPWSHVLGDAWDVHADGPCCDTAFDLSRVANYRTETLQIQPGVTYAVTVETPLGTIQGRTTVPGPFQVFAPDPSQVLRWTRSRGALAYQVVTPVREALVTDTLFVGEPGEFGQSGPSTRVTALDSNYTEYLRRAQGEARRPEITPAAVGLTGGYGLFGSVYEQRPR